MQMVAKMYEGHPKRFQPQHVRQQYFKRSIYQRNVLQHQTHSGGSL